MFWKSKSRQLEKLVKEVSDSMIRNAPVIAERVGTETITWKNTIMPEHFYGGTKK